MAASSMIIVDRKKVYTVETNLLIKRENFPALLKRLKDKYLKQEELQAARSVHQALKSLGWTARGNCPGITQLIYNDDYWKMRASFALSEIAPFVEDGGFITVLNTKLGNCKTLAFENGRVERRASEMRFTDSQSYATLKEDLRYAVTKLLDLGATADEVHDLVTEQIILDFFRN